jgi:hypothetical protein
MDETSFCTLLTVAGEPLRTLFPTVLQVISKNEAKGGRLFLRNRSDEYYILNLLGTKLAEAGNVGYRKSILHPLDYQARMKFKTQLYSLACLTSLPATSNQYTYNSNMRTYSISRAYC